MTDNLSGQAITPGQRLFSLHCDHDDPEGSWLHLRPKYRDRWERTASAFNAEAAATLERVEREREDAERRAGKYLGSAFAADARVEALRKALEEARQSLNEDAAAGWRVRAVARIEAALSVPASGKPSTPGEVGSTSPVASRDEPNLARRDSEVSTQTGAEESSAKAVLTLTEAMLIAEAGYDAWAAKPHNKGWRRKIDGTPIPNDLPVCIAQAFYDALKAAPAEARSDQAVRELLREAAVALQQACIRFQAIEQYSRRLGPLPAVEAAHEHAEKVLCKIAEFGVPTPPKAEADHG